MATSNSRECTDMVRKHDGMCELHDMGLLSRPCSCPQIARRGKILPVELVPRGPFIAIKDGVVVATVARPSMEPIVDAEIRNAERLMLFSAKVLETLCRMAKRYRRKRDVRLDEVYALLQEVDAKVDVERLAE